MTYKIEIKFPDLSHNLFQNLTTFWGNDPDFDF